ncbi:MAG: formate dehydrogenase accessory protein FdhE [Chloroflexi bacterium]|nr:formate dehydrogenase accessory protein FdhE [Chloroflexota bacterium]
MTVRQQQLAELIAEQPAMADMVALYQDIVKAQGRYSVAQPVRPPTAAAIQSQIDSGRPVATLCSECFDWPAMAALAGDICEITTRHYPEMETDLQSLRTWLSEEGPEALSACLFGNAFPLLDLEDSSLIIFVLNHASYPWLHAVAQTLGPLPTYEHWERGDCPLCGGSPDLSYLQSQTGQRHLICSRCDTDWGFRRLGCPFCGTTTEGQRYFVDDNTGHRLYRCDSCGRYLKTIDRRMFWKEYTPMVERLRTLDLDVLAQQMARGVGNDSGMVNDVGGGQ